MHLLSSPFSHRYHFAEMRYHRPEEMHKGRLVPARVETVVIFLPDVWSCSPSHLEWEAMQSSYKKQLQQKIAEENKDETQAAHLYSDITCHPPSYHSSIISRGILTLLLFCSNCRSFETRNYCRNF